MNYFGQPWDAPVITDGGIPVRTPVGWPCMTCRLPITDGQRGFVLPSFANGWANTVAVHVGCHLLGIIGHQYGICHCTGYDTEGPAAYEAGIALGRRTLASWAFP